MSDDDALIEELRRAMRQADPVPEHVRAAAAAAFAFRDPSAALASLVGELATVRDGGGDDQILSYEHHGARVDLEVSTTGDGTLLTGQLTGAAAGDGELETGDGARLPVPVDEYGRFLLTDVPHGPARLHVRADAGPIVTPWFVL